MGRSIRRVAKNWKHPEIAPGNYQPQFDIYYGDAIEEWIKNHYLWLKGKHPYQKKGSFGYPESLKYKYLAMYDGSPPDVEYCRNVKWKPEQRTHYQLYENVTEGTPLSPVFSSKKKMGQWLVENDYCKQEEVNDYIKMFLEEADRLI